MPRHKPAIERIMERVRRDVETGCWVYTGRLDDGGYGRISDGGKEKRTHRLICEAHKGPIPEGMEPDHLCRNRACCNPDHLEVVTQLENILRGEGPCAQNARKAVCGRGHPFEPRPAGRVCRTCQRESQRRWARENKNKGRAYYLANQEAIKARTRARYATNREEILLRRRERYAKERAAQS